MKFDMPVRKFSETTCSHIKKEHWLQYELGQKIPITESASGGAGTVNITSAYRCVLTKGCSNNHPISWSSIQACADGAIFEFTPGGVRVHIIELKKTITKKTWRHMKEQFAGMLINIIAIKGIAGIGELSEIRVYAAYQNDRFAPETSPNPILLKVALGTGRTVAGVDDWRNQKIELLDNKHVEVIRIMRDANGDATYRF